jgi:hypothetical protein
VTAASAAHQCPAAARRRGCMRECCADHTCEEREKHDKAEHVDPDLRALFLARCSLCCCLPLRLSLPQASHSAWRLRSKCRGYEFHLSRLECLCFHSPLTSGVHLYSGGTTESQCFSAHFGARPSEVQNQLYRFVGYVFGCVSLLPPTTGFLFGQHALSC